MLALHTSMHDLFGLLVGCRLQSDRVPCTSLDISDQHTDVLRLTTSNVYSYWQVFVGDFLCQFYHLLLFFFLNDFTVSGWLFHRSKKYIVTLYSAIVQCYYVDVPAARAVFPLAKVYEDKKGIACGLGNSCSCITCEIGTVQLPLDTRLP